MVPYRLLSGFQISLAFAVTVLVTADLNSGTEIDCGSEQEKKYCSCISALVCQKKKKITLNDNWLIISMLRKKSYSTFYKLH